MFKRELTVKMDKIKKDQTPETTVDPKEFEKKATTVLRNLEVLGLKVFLGVCIYVILDTKRQVAVAQVKTQ